mmetsp:Transcript_74421/g.177321  ORF Transcript_74421/g.177321 Transcript_74421/m.177321 type:complete len:299 (+) Transcript_74421:61-957(+)
MAAASDDDFLAELGKALQSRRMPLASLAKDDQVEDKRKAEQEVLAALRAMGFTPTKEELQAVVKRLEQDKEKNREKLDTLPFPKPRLDHTDSWRSDPTLVEREEFRQIFALFKQLCRTRREPDEGDRVSLVDWDQTGSISVDELHDVLETVGMRMDQGDLEAVMGNLDVDGNGEIDFQEFCDNLSSRVSVDFTPEDIAESFKVFAKKAPDGFIKVADLRAALQTFMHKDLIDSEIDGLLVHFQDSMGCFPGGEEEFFNYQDYIDLMTPLVAIDPSTPSRRRLTAKSPSSRSRTPKMGP